jgi:hypothetical protein
LSFELAERGRNEGLEEADDMIIERGSKGINICGKRGPGGGRRREREGT